MTTSAAQDEIKFPRPKVLLIDIDTRASEALRAAGYNVLEGTFGCPYEVPVSDELEPVIPNDSLPETIGEQEIVVVDLVPRETLSEPSGQKATSPGSVDWYGSCSTGLIDPRPKLMAFARKRFDEIVYSGGVVIIFADSRSSQQLKLGYIEPGYKGFQEKAPLPFDNWCLLSVLHEEHLEVSFERGEEISVLSATEKAVPSLVRTLQDHTRGANFRCTMKPTYRLRDSWLPLATNKYGRPVAGAICPQAATKGWVVILHHVADLPNFLLKLLGEALPDMVPYLFPHLEGARWVQRPEYELPKIIELKATIYEVQENARKQVAVLEDAIAQERLAAGYLHDLITETGRPLASAVKKTLETLGFQKVVDVDEEARRAGDKEKRGSARICKSMMIRLSFL